MSQEFVSQPKIKHIKQRHSKGCVIACLSMITNIPYDDILSDFTGDRHEEGISMFSYDPWLYQKGYAIIRKYRLYQPLHADVKEWPCKPFADIHLISSRNNWGSHACVWMADGTVLDPMEDEPRKIEDYSAIENVAGLFKVIESSDPGPLIYLHWSNGEKCIWCGASHDSYEYHDPCPARNSI